MRAGDGLDLSVVTTVRSTPATATSRSGSSTPTASGWSPSACCVPASRAPSRSARTLIDQGYVVVDISKEQFDDKPAHSGDSLLRGQLPA